MRSEGIAHSFPVSVIQGYQGFRQGFFHVFPMVLPQSILRSEGIAHSFPVSVIQGYQGFKQGFFHVFPLVFAFFPSWPRSLRICLASVIQKKRPVGSGLTVNETRAIAKWSTHRKKQTGRVPFFSRNFAFISNKSRFVSMHNEELVVGSDRLNSSWKTLPSQHVFQARNYYLGYDTSKMGSSINHQHIINHHTNQPSTRLTQNWWQSSDRKHPKNASASFRLFCQICCPQGFLRWWKISDPDLLRRPY